MESFIGEKVSGKQTCFCTALCGEVSRTTTSAEDGGCVPLHRSDWCKCLRHGTAGS